MPANYNRRWNNRNWDAVKHEVRQRPREQYDPTERGIVRSAEDLLMRLCGVEPDYLRIAPDPAMVKREQSDLAALLRGRR